MSGPLHNELEHPGGEHVLEQSGSFPDGQEKVRRKRTDQGKAMLFPGISSNDLLVIYLAMFIVTY